MENDFIRAIHRRTKIIVTFYDKNNEILTRDCAPMDFGAAKQYKDNKDRFHFWNFKGKYPLLLLPKQIIDLEFTTILFEPALFVDWVTDWHIKRNWGKAS